MTKAILSTGNVFKDLGFDSEEAENLRLRAEMMVALRSYIEKEGITQKEAADHFGVTQPRMSDLMRGKIGKFTIDMLVNITVITVRIMHMTPGTIKIPLSMEGL